MRWGDAIAIARAARRMSQIDLARAIQLDPSFISLIEKGARGASLETLEKVAGAVRLPFWQLTLLATPVEQLRQDASMEGLARTVLLTLLGDGA